MEQRLRGSSGFFSLLPESGNDSTKIAVIVDGDFVVIRAEVVISMFFYGL